MIFEKVLDTINRHNLIEKGDKIRAISVNEIKGYTEYGSDADLMLVSSTGEQLRNVYIIR